MTQWFKVCDHFMFVIHAYECCSWESLWIYRSPIGLIKVWYNNSLVFRFSILSLVCLHLNAPFFLVTFILSLYLKLFIIKWIVPIWIHYYLFLLPLWFLFCGENIFLFDLKYVNIKVKLMIMLICETFTY